MGETFVDAAYRRGAIEAGYAFRDAVAAASGAASPAPAFKELGCINIDNRNSTATVIISKTLDVPAFFLPSSVTSA